MSSSTVWDPVLEGPGRVDSEGLTLRPFRNLAFANDNNNALFLQATAVGGGSSLAFSAPAATGWTFQPNGDTIVASRSAAEPATSSALANTVAPTILATVDSEAGKPTTFEVSGGSRALVSFPARTDTYLITHIAPSPETPGLLFACESLNDNANILYKQPWMLEWQSFAGTSDIPLITSATVSWILPVSDDIVLVGRLPPPEASGVMSEILMVVHSGGSYDITVSATPSDGYRVHEALGDGKFIVIGQNTAFGSIYMTAGSLTTTAATLAANSVDVTEKFLSEPLNIFTSTGNADRLYLAVDLSGTVDNTFTVSADAVVGSGSITADDLVQGTMTLPSDTKVVNSVFFGGRDNNTLYACTTTNGNVAKILKESSTNDFTTEVVSSGIGTDGSLVSACVLNDDETRWLISVDGTTNLYAVNSTTGAASVDTSYSPLIPFPDDVPVQSRSYMHLGAVALPSIPTVFGYVYQGATQRTVYVDADPPAPTPTATPPEPSTTATATPSAKTKGNVTLAISLGTVAAAILIVAAAVMLALMASSA